MEAIDLMKIAVKGADDKKAHNIRVLDIKELTTLADLIHTDECCV